MIFCSVDGLGEGYGPLNVFGLRCILESKLGILRGRPWTLKLYGLRWWGNFGMVE